MNNQAIQAMIQRVTQRVAQGIATDEEVNFYLNVTAPSVAKNQNPSPNFGQHQNVNSTSQFGNTMNNQAPPSLGPKTVWNGVPSVVSFTNQTNSTGPRTAQLNQPQQPSAMVSSSGRGVASANIANSSAQSLTVSFSGKGGVSNVLVSSAKTKMEDHSATLAALFTNLSDSEAKIYIKYMEKITISNLLVFQTEKKSKLEKVETRLKSKGVKPETSREYRNLRDDLEILQASLSQRLWSKSVSEDACKWGAVMLTPEFTDIAATTLRANSYYKPTAKIAYYQRRGAWVGLSFNQVFTHVMTRLRVNKFVLQEFQNRGLAYDSKSLEFTYPAGASPAGDSNPFLYDPIAPNIPSQLQTLKNTIQINLRSMSSGDLALCLCPVNPLILFGTKEVAVLRSQPLGHYGVAIQKSMSYYFEILRALNISVQIPDRYSFRANSEFMTLYYNCFALAKRLIAMIEGLTLQKERAPRIGKAVARQVVNTTEGAYSDDFTDLSASQGTSNLEEVMSSQRKSQFTTVLNNVKNTKAAVSIDKGAQQAPDTIGTQNFVANSPDVKPATTSYPQSVQQDFSATPITLPASKKSTSPSQPRNTTPLSNEDGFDVPIEDEEEEGVTPYDNQAIGSAIQNSTLTGDPLKYVADNLLDLVSKNLSLFTVTDTSIIGTMTMSDFKKLGILFPPIGSILGSGKPFIMPDGKPFVLKVKSEDSDKVISNSNV